MANSHKRDTDARRQFRMPKAPHLAGGLAVAATLATVGFGVVTAESDTRDAVVASSSQNIAAAAEREVDPAERPQVVSRSQDRIVREEPWEDLLEPRVVARAVRNADTRLWTTAPLNLWATPGEDAARRGLLEEARKVLVTGRRAAGRVELVVGGQARWVTRGYLTDVNPNRDRSGNGGDGDAAGDAASSEPAAPSLGGACTNGSSVDGQANVIAVHQAVCAAFPDLTSYGTYRSDGDHAQGLAIDIMVSGSRGWEVAEFVRANYSELGVSYVMYAQRIWSVDRAGEGWRYVEDRGSATANHYDHVHVTTY